MQSHHAQMHMQLQVILQKINEKNKKILMVCVENWRKHMIVYLSLSIKEATLYRSHWSTWHFFHLVQQLHDWMEARDYYPAMSGDKLPMVFNSSRISLSTSSVYLIYICDLPAVVQHCSICIYADGTSIYISTSTCSVCPAGGRYILGAFMIVSNIMDSR